MLENNDSNNIAIDCLKVQRALMNLQKDLGNEKSRYFLSCLCTEYFTTSCHHALLPPQFELLIDVFGDLAQIIDEIKSPEYRAEHYDGYQKTINDVLNKITGEEQVFLIKRYKIDALWNRFELGNLPHSLRQFIYFVEDQEKYNKSAIELIELLSESASSISPDTIAGQLICDILSLAYDDDFANFNMIENNISGINMISKSNISLNADKLNIRMLQLAGKSELVVKRIYHAWRVVSCFFSDS